MQWGLQPSKAITVRTAATPCVSFGWHAPAIGFQHLMQFTTATGSEPAYAPEMIQRVYAHMLIDGIPNVGLAETIESLHQISEFYPSSPPVPLRPRTIAGQARIVGTKLREIVPIPME